MAQSFDELVPKLKEAREKYQSGGLEAFAGVEPRICGAVEVLPFTAQMFLELEGAGNRFVGGRGSPEFLDAMQFLWRVSSVYSRTDAATREDFIRLLPIALMDQTEGAVIADICAYVRRAWLGMPMFRSSGNNGGGSKSPSTWISHLVHMLAKEYGWTEDCILNLPFRRLWQYVNRILEDQNSKYRELCGEEEELKARWLQQQNERN